MHFNADTRLTTGKTNKRQKRRNILEITCNSCTQTNKKVLHTLPIGLNEQIYTCIYLDYILK